MAKTRQRRGQNPPPRCKAILLCDQTILDAVTGNVSIIGTFTEFILPSFPGRTKPVCAFLLLIDGIGRYQVVVEIHDLGEDKIIARSPGMAIHFPERLARINFVTQIPPLPLVHPGTYDVVVLANGQEIDRQQFKAVKREDTDAH